MISPLTNFSRFFLVLPKLGSSGPAAFTSYVVLNCRCRCMPLPLAHPRFRIREEGLGDSFVSGPEFEPLKPQKLLDGGVVWV